MKEIFFKFSDLKILILAGCFVSSCSTYKNISYFKNIESTDSMYYAGEDIPASRFEPLKIGPDDILKVTVTTLDQDVNGAANITIANQSGLSAAMPGISRNVDGFLVNKDGMIDLPMLGSLEVGGLTVDQAREEIQKLANTLFKNPTVNVRLTNFKVTILGEVAKPGTYVVDGERISVLDALGLSGDLTIYAKRDNVLLIRQEAGEKKKAVRFNMNDKNMMNSPYFYLKQGDVIYVEPGKGKAAATDMAATRNYALAGSIIVVLITLISRIRF